MIRSWWWSRGAHGIRNHFLKRKREKEKEGAEFYKYCVACFRLETMRWMNELCDKRETAEDGSRGHFWRSRVRGACCFYYFVCPFHLLLRLSSFSAFSSLPFLLFWFLTHSHTLQSSSTHTQFQTHLSLSTFLSIGFVKHWRNNKMRGSFFFEGNVVWPEATNWICDFISIDLIKKKKN